MVNVEETKRKAKPIQIIKIKTKTQIRWETIIQPMFFPGTLMKVFLLQFDISQQNQVTRMSSLSGVDVEFLPRMGLTYPLVNNQFHLCVSRRLSARLSSRYRNRVAINDNSLLLSALKWLHFLRLNPRRCQPCCSNKMSPLYLLNNAEFQRG